MKKIVVLIFVVLFGALLCSSSSEARLFFGSDCKKRHHRDLYIDWGKKDMVSLPNMNCSNAEARESFWFNEWVKTQTELEQANDQIAEREEKISELEQGDSSRHYVVLDRHDSKTRWLDELANQPNGIEEFYYLSTHATNIPPTLFDLVNTPVWP